MLLCVHFAPLCKSPPLGVTVFNVSNNLHVSQHVVLQSPLAARYDCQVTAVYQAVGVEGI